MEVSFIRNKDEARELWAVAAPLLERCVRHSVRGEYSVDDIRAMVEEQAAVVVLVSEDKGAPPVLAVAAEVVPYGFRPCGRKYYGSRRLAAPGRLSAF